MVWVVYAVNFFGTIARRREKGMYVAIWFWFAPSCSPAAFGHGGAGGQVLWGDPRTGISFCYLTNSHERNELRSGMRGLALSSHAAACLRA